MLFEFGLLGACPPCIAFRWGCCALAAVRLWCAADCLLAVACHTLACSQHDVGSLAALPQVPVRQQSHVIARRTVLCAWEPKGFVSKHGVIGLRCFAAHKDTIAHTRASVVIACWTAPKGPGLLLHVLVCAAARHLWCLLLVHGH